MKQLVLVLLLLPILAYGQATNCPANKWLSGTDLTTTPVNYWTCTQPAFSDISGNPTIAQGGTGNTSATDDSLLVGNGTTFQLKALTTCTGSGKAVTYDVSTNTFGCNTIASSSSGTYVVVSGDVTNATTSYADITGLSWSVAASTRYDIECKLVYSANATTTGIGIGWTGPASPTLTGALMVTGITSATPGATTSVGNDTGGVTTASVATTGNSATFQGVWSNGSNAGTLQMRFKSEVAVAGGIVIKAGSFCKYITY